MPRLYSDESGLRGVTLAGAATDEEGKEEQSVGPSQPLTMTSPRTARKGRGSCRGARGRGIWHASAVWVTVGIDA